MATENKRLFLENFDVLNNLNHKKNLDLFAVKITKLRKKYEGDVLPRCPKSFNDATLCRRMASRRNINKNFRKTLLL